MASKGSSAQVRVRDLNKKAVRWGSLSSIAAARSKSVVPRDSSARVDFPERITSKIGKSRFA